MIKNLLTIGILFISLSISGCCRQDDTKTKNAQGKEVVATVDSPAERRAQALKFIANYPMNEWQDDIVARIRGIAGKSVSQGVRDLAGNKLSDKDLLEKRISLLTEVYNTADLTRLTELSSTRQGKDLLKKMTNYDEKLRELVAPLVAEALSTAP